MTENSKKNKDQNNEETTEKRLLFQKGGPGGPGRGHKSNKPDEDEIDGLDFWEATEKMIRKDLESGNEATRLKAVALYIKWKTLKEAHEKGVNKGKTPLDPAVAEIIGDRLGDLLDDASFENFIDE